MAEEIRDEQRTKDIISKKLDTKPKSLDGFVNCEDAKKIINMKIAAMSLGEKFEHTLITGPRGTGASTMAELICKELRVSHCSINAVNLNDFLSGFQVIIIDEVHKLREYKVFRQATIIGTTTENIPLPLVSRFQNKLYLGPYKLEDLETIIMNCARNNKLDIDLDSAHEIAIRSIGIPRIALNNFVHVLEYSKPNGGRIDLKTTMNAFTFHGIDAYGLNQ